VAKTAIGAFVFRTKQEAADEIRRILHGTQLRTPLEGIDAELITALVGIHPDAVTKIGTGIRCIETRIIDGGQPGFWITRTDGSMDDFSYRKALSGDRSPRAQCHQAMRYAVREQTAQFRRDEFSQHLVITCPLTGQELTPKQSHVDHINNFSRLADAFVLCFTEGYDRIPIGSSITHPGPALTEPTLTAWRQFHAEHAQLRVVHPSANLARARPAVAA
jgi:hypothetical protein